MPPGQKTSDFIEKLSSRVRTPMPTGGQVTFVNEEAAWPQKMPMEFQPAKVYCAANLQ